MIGLMFLVGIAIWLVVVIYLCKRIPRWVGITRHANVAGFALFPVLLVLPIADDLIGRWQFDRLCEREAVIWLSPDWMSVKKVVRNSLPREEIAGANIRVYKTVVEYSDAETKEVFLKTTHLSTYGGILFDRLGLGFDISRMCHPKNSDEVLKRVDIDSLVKKGNEK